MSLRDADFFVQQSVGAKTSQISADKVFIEEREDGIIFRIRVRPSASRNEIKRLHGEALKIDINAPPIRGKANRECIKFLANKLKIPKSDIKIIAGLKSNDKLIKIKGINKEEAFKVLINPTNPINPPKVILKE